jgi:hypothetical protein
VTWLPSVGEGVAVLGGVSGGVVAALLVPMGSRARDLVEFALELTSDDEMDEMDDADDCLACFDRR